MSGWTLIQAASLVAAPWRNGLGTSREIACVPGPDGGLGWTVSIAELERDGPFSHYPDADRVFTPIAGDPPPALAFDGGSYEPCPLLVPKRFPGDVPTASRVPARGRAFNAIVDRRRYRVSVDVLRIQAGAAAATRAAEAVVVHCVSGRVAVADQVLTAGDSLRGGGDAGPCAAAEDAAVLVVAIETLASADTEPPGAQDADHRE